LQHLADRYATTLSLAVVDVDRFKRVNDRFGHAAGDEVLRRLAAHLQAAFRGEDVVARLGGEEFVVAMLGMRREDAVERLSTVLTGFADTVLEVDNQQLRVGASAGVAQDGVDGSGFEELYRAADAALRVAKTSGRGRVLPAGASAVDQVEAVDVAIVEDDEILAELLRHTLTTQGYSCVVLSDGLEAVGRLADGRRPLRASVVLLDIDLPGRNGFEVLQALRRAEVTSRTAVLVVSARSSEDEALQALRLGARDHLSKPFSVPLLMQKLHSLLSDSR
jgi:diguanylate cyclase (GGDEF)-like protein